MEQDRRHTSGEEHLLNKNISSSFIDQINNMLTGFYAGSLSKDSCCQEDTHPMAKNKSKSLPSIVKVRRGGKTQQKPWLTGKNKWEKPQPQSKIKKTLKKIELSRFVQLADKGSSKQNDLMGDYLLKKSASKQNTSSRRQAILGPILMDKNLKKSVAAKALHQHARPTFTAYDGTLHQVNDKSKQQQKSKQSCTNHHQVVIGYHCKEALVEKPVNLEVIEAGHWNRQSEGNCPFDGTPFAVFLGKLA